MNADMNDRSILHVLDSFQPISLEKMNKVRLMNRIDRKYLFPVNLLPELLSGISGKYLIMEIDNLRTFPYLTTYFDTPDLLFYHQHMRGKGERFKIRQRTYLSSGISYLEIKKKSKKGRTEKKRIAYPSDFNDFDERALSFILSNTEVDPGLLRPVLMTSFSRTTIVNITSGERITFDHNLEMFDSQYKTGFPFLAVAELKKEMSSGPSLFAERAKELGIRPTGFSKYCMGCHYLLNPPRANLLKKKVLLINRIKDESDNVARA